MVDLEPEDIELARFLGRIISIGFFLIILVLVIGGLVRAIGWALRGFGF